MSDTTDWNEYEVIYAGRRIGVQRPGWMGDWFTSWSPRNDNSNAEGTWSEWIGLAIQILQHEATALLRPDAAAAVTGVVPGGGRDLTESEIAALFPSDGAR